LIEKGADVNIVSSLETPCPVSSFLNMAVFLLLG
jgi:hypothetical protein